MHAGFVNFGTIRIFGGGRRLSDDDETKGATHYCEMMLVYLVKFNRACYVVGPHRCCLYVVRIGVGGAKVHILYDNSRSMPEWHVMERAIDRRAVSDH